MKKFSTQMQNEAIEFPTIIENHIKNHPLIEQLISELKKNHFDYVCTIARGSSNNAALFARYLIENYIQKPVCSTAPSVCSVYKSAVEFNSSLVIAISQSGQSGDLVQTLRGAKQRGGITLAFINCDNSPLASYAQYVVQLSAGQENSVAATKSFLASLSRLLQFVIIYADNLLMKQLYFGFPNILRGVLNSYSWDEFLSPFENINSLFIIGRGYGFPIALEAALKLKETCSVHAEGLSGAEILHGPFELINEKFSAFVFLQQDETLPSLLALLELFSQKKVCVFVVGTEDILSLLTGKGFYLMATAIQSFHPVLDLFVSINCFYMFVAQLSLLKGRNPDKPMNLKKVTKTI